MIFGLGSEENLVMDNKDNRVFRSRNYQPIVPRQKHSVV